MLKFLLGILLFFGLVILFVTSLGISLLRSLFRSDSKVARGQEESVHRRSKEEDRDKIFGNHEGEYVDFEEVSEDDKKTEN